MCHHQQDGKVERKNIRGKSAPDYEISGVQDDYNLEVMIYYCWINSKAMAEGRKRVAICAMKQERPQLVWLCVHPTH